MHFYANLSLSKEKDETSKEILKNSLNGKGRIDVVSMFYNSADILLETIIAYANENKKILYITNEETSEINISYFIENFSNLGGYIYNRETKYSSDDGHLYICNHESTLQLQEKFDLVIYNEIRSFPIYSKQQIKRTLLKMCSHEGTAISYSVENVLNEGTTIMSLVTNNKTPIIEPRIITTRINLNVEIPLVVYEYLNWSIMSNRKVIIFTPDAQKAEAVFKYLSNLKDKLSENLFIYLSKKSDAGIPIVFMNKNNGIIVTNDFEESYLKFCGVDIIVCFADDNKFTHKQLLYLSSKVGRYENIQRGEAIFLANIETAQMDKAKSIARKFNEKAWEKGLLNI